MQKEFKKQNLLTEKTTIFPPFKIKAAGLPEW